MMPSHTRGRLALVILIFLLLGLTNSILLPLHKAHDESAHFRYARFIAQTGRLPLTQAERDSADYRANQPPLYHILFALLAGWSDSNEPPQPKYVWQSARFELAHQLLDTKRLANTEDEFFPWQGPILMWHLGRIIALLLGMGIVLITYTTTRLIFPHNSWLALVCAAIIAFWPTFIFISSSLSDDPLLGLWVGLYFVFIIKVVQGDIRWRNFLLIGLFTGLALASKNAALIVPLEAVLLLTLLAWRQGWGWLALLKRLAAVTGAAVIASGWWYGTVIIYFNQIQEFGFFSGILKPLLAGGVNASEQYTAYVLSGGEIGIGDSPELMAEPFWLWALHLYRTFWVEEIGYYPLSPWAHIAAGAVCLLALAGLLHAWRSQPERRVWIGLLVTHTAFFLVFPILRHAIQGNATQTAQGRHLLFPIATILPLLITLGWPGWFSQQAQRLLALAITGGLLTWSMVLLVGVATYPIYYLPLTTTPDTLAEIQQPLNISFATGPRLVGYNLDQDAAENALKLTLYWHSDHYSPEDYQVNVALNHEGEPALQWTLYPVNGRYPSRIWEANEVIRDDIWLPLVDIAPGEYDLQLQLLGRQGALTVDQGEGLTSLTLQSVSVPQAATFRPEIPLEIKLEQRQVVSGVSLWQAERYHYIDLPRYQPRMQIPFVWQGSPNPGERVAWLLVGPDGATYPAQTLTEHAGFFQVGLDWPSGRYRLRAEVWRNEAVLASQEVGPLLTIQNEQPRLVEVPSLRQPLDVNFANKIKLLGYDLPLRQLEKGQGIPLTLYWQGLRTMDTSYTLFAKLLDGTGQAWGSVERLPADGYNTIYWLEDEVVVDGFQLLPDPEIPPGIYWLNLGFYENVDQQAVSLPVITVAGQEGPTSITLGPVKVGDPALDVVPASAIPEHALIAEFGRGNNGNLIQLQGFDGPLLGSDALQLTLYWHSLGQTNQDFTTFVHLHNDRGELVAQMDRPPLNNHYPTALWSPGEVIPDTFEVPLPPNLAAGSYQVVVGWYDFNSGERLQINGTVMDSLPLTEVVIE